MRKTSLKAKGRVMMVSRGMQSWRLSQKPSRKGEGKTLTWLIMWIKSQVSLLSKVAVWQRLAFLKLVFFLPEKVRSSPPGEGMTVIFYYRTIVCCVCDAQSHLFMGCCCRHGLMKTLFWKNICSERTQTVQSNNIILFVNLNYLFRFPL